MTLLSFTGRDTAAQRATLQALVSFQQGTLVAGLPLRSRAEWMSGLTAFQARATTAAARPFAQRYLAAFERAFTQLVDAALAQPAVALLPALHPELSGGGAGPITQDIACLLRQQPLEEDVELDLAVRWWQLARAAGLPVDADFGECLRLLEWTSLLHQLAQPDAQRPDLAAAVKVAMRYATLKPLVLLLEPLGGAQAQAGYTF